MSDQTAAVGPWRQLWRRLRGNPRFLLSAAIVVLLAVMAAWPEAFTSIAPYNCDLSQALAPPSAGHWFGYDGQGCDYYTQAIYGARASMTIGVAVVGSATLIAVVVGSLTGYFGGTLDAIVGRLTDVWFGIPLILAGVVMLSFMEDRGLWQVSAVLIVFGWPLMLRLMRTSVLEVKQAEYVDAARAIGAGDLRIVFRHVLPNAFTPVLVYGTIYIGTIITAEAILSFMGVGLQLPAISWGIMLAEAGNNIRGAPHLLLPGLLLSAAVFGFVLLGDALREAL